MKDLNCATIIELQEKNINLSTQIDSSKEEVESLENTIGEIQSGYDNLLETGEFLMKLVNSNKVK